MSNGLIIENNWETVFNNSFTAAINEETGKSLPIGKILIPIAFTAKFIRIYLNSTTAKSHWWLGGNLSQLLENDSQIDFVAQSWRIPLKVIFLIEVELLTTEYKLKFEPAPWLKHIAIVIEKYIGD
jgi:hypothetical protein